MKKKSETGEPGILVINPGNLTTKIALFEGEEDKFEEESVHSSRELGKCKSYLEQLSLRKAPVLEFIKKHNVVLSAIACRGAPLKPLQGGTYRVNRKMVEDIRNGELQTPHVAILAALIGWDIAESLGIPAYITDPISVDEFIPIARISGLPEVPRRSLWHALNCRAVARQYAREHGEPFSTQNLIVAHMGSGITIAAFKEGKAIDCTNANSESAFSPARAANAPLLDLVELCYSGKYTKDEMIRRLIREGGLTAHLGTSDAVLIEERIGEGDLKARQVYEAMAYQVSKHIGAMGAVLEGRVGAILLTGSLARSPMLVRWIRKRVSSIAPVKVYPGQEEMKALALGVLDVLTGNEKEKIYQ